MLQGRNHTYAQYRLSNGRELVLCSFCWVDSSSWHPEAFGLPRSTKLGPGDWELVSDVPAELIKDKVCPECGGRRAMFRFING